MTAVAGVVWRNRCWLAADRCVSSKHTRILTAAPKAVRHRNYVIGAAGSIEGLRAVLDAAWPDDPAWLPGAAVEVATQLERAKLDAGETDLLIGYRGRLWHYESSQIYPCAEPWAAIGEAEPFLLGWLVATRTGWSPVERLRGALQEAEIYQHRVCCGREGPVIVSTPAGGMKQ